MSPEVQGQLEDDDDGWNLVSALSASVSARTRGSGYTVPGEKGSSEDRSKSGSSADGGY